MPSTEVFHNKAAIKLAQYPDNHFDSCVTDPPYGLGKEPDAMEVLKDWIDHGYHEVKSKGGFMGKEWDSFVPQPNEWKEVFRTLKPGGYLVAACGTRTYDWMVLSIRLAGFEIRDVFAWHYGQGFPKSKNFYDDMINVATSMAKFELDIQDVLLWQRNTLKRQDQKSVLQSHALIVEDKLKKTREKAARNTIKENTVQEPVINKHSQQKYPIYVLTAESHLKDQFPIVDQSVFIVVDNAEVNTIQLKEDVTRVQSILQDQEVNVSTSIFIVPVNVRQLLREKTMEIIREEEVQKIFHGGQRFSKQENTNALCAATTSALRRIILDQLKHIRNYDTILKTDCVSAISVITTKSTMECLIISMVNIAIEKIKNYKGYGTALKPATELWVIARKPLSEKTLAENVLKWGTGGLNIDGSRTGPVDKGRWPSNVILSHHPDCVLTETNEEWKCVDGCPIKEMDDQSGILTSGLMQGAHKGFGARGIYGTSGFSESPTYGDSGGASRFFYCAKASTSERNKGLENLGFKRIIGNNRFDKCKNCGGYILQNPDLESACKCENPEKEDNIVEGNYHPTVKPVALMRYLVRLVTPPGGKVCDPYNGSGTTGIACKLEGFDYVGIEQDEDMVLISLYRIRAWEPEYSLPENSLIAGL
jgi:DNA modification methylase